MTDGRLFFALVPDEQTLQQIVLTIQLLEPGIKEKVTAKEKLHMTLPYLGVVADEAVNSIKNLVDNVQLSSFCLKIDKLEYWKRSRISVLVPNEAPEQLADLVACLRQIVSTCGLPDESMAFKPHVTVIRKSLRHHLPECYKAIEWKVKDFVLLSSVPKEGGVEYVELGRWQLTENI